MESYNPFFQLEVRYTPILDFTNFSRTLLAPYIKLTDRIGVDQENTFKETFQLISDKDKYLIAVNWDRIYLRGQGDITEMENDNSTVEQIFFQILGDILKYKEFAEIRSYLLFISTVWFPEDDSGNVSNISHFTNNYIKSKATNLLNSTTDMALELIYKGDQNETTLTLGPYFGLDDLQKRKAQPSFEVEDFNLDREGQMAEIKIFERNNHFDFNKFKELVKIYREYYAKL
ncbi:MAG: hypothetical protein R6V04_08525 [bacterium]